MMNILNGGAHADTDVDIQEFMIAPVGAATFAEALRWGAETYHALKAVLKERGLSTGLGDEGGLRAQPAGEPRGARPHRRGDRQGRVPRGRRHRAGARRRRDRVLRRRHLPVRGRGTKSAAELTAYYADLVAAYPIVSIEDPMAEDDWDGWNALTAELGDRVQIVGDDLFVTNPERGSHAASETAPPTRCSSRSTRSARCPRRSTRSSLAHRNGYALHDEPPLGETEDTTIADLAVATNCGQIKTGAPARSDRVAKYNQLLRIEEELDDAARYAGALAFPLSHHPPPLRVARLGRLPMRLPRQRPAQRRNAPATPRAGRDRRPVVHRRTRSTGANEKARSDRQRSRRTGLTSRAAVLAVAVCAVVLTLAVPFQQYVAQRAQLNGLMAQERAERSRVAALQQAQARWQDPAFIREQARERLHFVKPGETAYVIVGPAPAVQPATAAPARKTTSGSGPWYSQLWSTVVTAGAEPTTSKHPAAPRPATPKPITPPAQH